jgi:type IV pilus assembly protein PilQ
MKSIICFILMLCVVSLSAAKVQDAVSWKEIKILEYTGTFRIVTLKQKIITVSQKEKIPHIPSGSRIKVLTGALVAGVGNITISMGKGGIIQVWGDEARKLIALSVAPESAGAVKVKAGEKEMLVNAGKKIKVASEGRLPEVADANKKPVTKKSVKKIHPWADIKIVKHTGTFRAVTVEREIITVSRKEKVSHIPSGSRIRVLTGILKTDVGNITISMGKGSIIQVWSEETRKLTTLSVDPGSAGTVKVKAGEKEVVVNAGEKIKVAGEGRSPEVTVTKGEVEVKDASGSTTMMKAVAEKIPEPTVTLNFRSMRLEDILKIVSKQTGMNFITSEKIRGSKFTVYLENVTLRKALDSLLSAHGLIYEQFPESNIFVINERTETKPRVITRVFRLKYIQLAGSVSKGGQSSKTAFSFIDTSDKEAQADAGPESGESSIVAIVRSILSENGRLQVDPYTNALIITDRPERFVQIAELIEQLDVMTPQIYIEAEIVEINTDVMREIGIEYGLSDGTLAKLVGPARVMQFPTLDNANRLLPTQEDLVGATVKTMGDYGTNMKTGSHFGILSFQELQGVLRAIELSGEGKFLAKPKILTLNNKTAAISVTADTAVGIQSASMIAQSGLLVTTAERYTTGVNLRVTPQVNEEDNITLLIEPNISRPRSSEFFPGQFVDPQNTTLTTSVRVKSGETVLIGGLLYTEQKNLVRRIPILGRIPLLGMLFTSSEKTSVKRELMIFITPRRVVT